MQFSKQFVPFLSIMTRIEGRKDDDLLLTKGGQGFPHIAFMDGEGGIIAVVEGERTVAGFEKTFKEDARRFIDLSAKAKAGDAAAQVDFALLEAKIGRIALDEASKRIEGRKLTDAQKAAFAELEIESWLAALNGAQDEASAEALAKKIAEALKAGRMPANPNTKQQFLGVSLWYALEKQKDPDLAQKAFDALKPVYEEMAGKDDPRIAQWAKQTSDKIADLRAAKKAPPSDEGIEESDEGDK